MKAPLAEVRKKGILLSASIDDIILFGDSHDDCLRDLAETSTILHKLGLLFTLTNHIFFPTQELVVN